MSLSCIYGCNRYDVAAKDQDHVMLHLIPFIMPFSVLHGSNMHCLPKDQSTKLLAHSLYSMRSFLASPYAVLLSNGRLFLYLPILGCHLPPIPDAQLVEIIRAFNEARKSKPDASLNWRCASCLKEKAKHDPIIIDDDDDSIQIVEAPTKPLSSTKRIPTENASSRPFSHSSTSAKVTSSRPKERTVQIIDDPIDYLIPSTSRAPLIEQHSSSSTRSLASGYPTSSVAEGPKPQSYKSDNALEYTDTPRPSPEPQNQRAASLSNSHTGTGACLSFPASASTPASATITSASSSRPDVHHSHPTREPRQTPTLIPTPSIDTSNPISNQLHTQAQRKLERPPIFHPSLLPHYINARYRSIESNDPTKISDTWYLSTVQRSKLGTHVSRKKKMKAVRNHTKVRSNNPNSEALASKDPFFFFADTWMKEKENSLANFLESS